MKNFSLSLYAFHLHHTFTDARGDVKANLLWENLAKLGEGSLPFPELKDLRSKLICYQYGKYEPKGEEGRQTEWLSDIGKLDLGSLATTKDFEIKATLQPFLVHDTYIADLTLLPEPRDISIDIPQLQHFKPSCLLPSNIQASLGQTLWIYGEVDPSAKCDKVANQFAKALVEGTKLKTVIINQGKFFGSLLFEYQANEPNEMDNPTKQCQIFIVINNSESQTLKLAGDAYDSLRNLLCSYHKIVYTNHLARQRYRQGKAIYSYLEKKIQEFNNLLKSDIQKQLSELKKILVEIPPKRLDYTRCLQDLITDHTTINTNLTNYRSSLNQITGINGVNSPQSWQNSLNKDCHKLQEQIKTDIDYLSPGQELFEQIVDTIRGIVEIEQVELEKEQAERDRSLENTIQVVGVALGSGAIVSGVVSQYIQQPVSLPYLKPSIPPMLSSFFWTVLTTLVAGALAWGWTQLKK